MIRNQKRLEEAAECSRGWSEAEPVDGLQTSFDAAPTGTERSGRMSRAFRDRWVFAEWGCCRTGRSTLLDATESLRYAQGNRSAVGGRGALLPLVGPGRGGLSCLQQRMRSYGDHLIPMTYGTMITCESGDPTRIMLPNGKRLVGDRVPAIPRLARLHGMFVSPAHGSGNATVQRFLQAA